MENRRSPSRWGFSSARVVVVECDQLQPCRQFHVESHDRAPYPGLVKPVQRKVLQRSIFGVADAILLAVPAVAKYRSAN